MMTSLFDWAETNSSDGRADKAVAREVSAVVGEVACHATSSNHDGGAQAGMGSEWPSPSGAEWNGICACGKAAHDGIRCRLGAMHQPRERRNGYQARGRDAGDAGDVIP
jgi:hypothetical protein